MNAQLLFKAWLCIVFAGLVFASIGEIGASQDDSYEISITDTTYEKTDVNDVHNIVYYNISVTLENSGTIESEDITLQITDEDGNYTRNGTILPGSSKTFIFTDHPLIGLNDHTISLSFFPTDQFAPKNEYNSGEDSLTLIYNQGSGFDTTPGFEAFFTLIILSLFVLIKKVRK